MKKPLSLNSQIGNLSNSLKELKVLKTSNSLSQEQLERIENITYSVRDIQYKLLGSVPPIRKKQKQPSLPMSIILHILSVECSKKDNTNIDYAQACYSIKNRLQTVQNYIDLHPGCLDLQKTDTEDTTEAKAHKFLDSIRNTSIHNSLSRYLTPEVLRTASNIIAKEQQAVINSGSVSNSISDLL